MTTSGGLRLQPAGLRPRSYCSERISRTGTKPGRSEAGREGSHAPQPARPSPLLLFPRCLQIGVSCKRPNRPGAASAFPARHHAGHTLVSSPKAGLQEKEGLRTPPPPSTPSSAPGIGGPPRVYTLPLPDSGSDTSHAQEPSGTRPPARSGPVSENSKGHGPSMRSVLNPTPARSRLAPEEDERASILNNFYYMFSALYTKEISCFLQ